MAIRQSNYIAGEWVAGESNIENRNPSDLSDLIGLYAQASAEQLESALDAARAAQADWARVGIQRRACETLVVFECQAHVEKCLAPRRFASTVSRRRAVLARPDVVVTEIAGQLSGRKCEHRGGADAGGLVPALRARVPPIQTPRPVRVRAAGRFGSAMLPIW